MRNLSVAARRLKSIVRPSQAVTQKSVADYLGCTQQAVSAWLNGITKPEPGHRESLFARFGIRPDEWADDPAESGRSVVSKADESGTNAIVEETPTGTGGR